MKKPGLLSVIWLQLPAYIKYKINSRLTVKSQRIIRLEIISVDFKRYLYLLLKFFHTEGFTIYTTDSLIWFARIKADPYLRYLLTERILIFGKPEPSQSISSLRLNDWQLLADYFGFKKEPNQTGFLFPMSQHPLMYHAGWWNTPVPRVARKKSLFMAGNFSVEDYDSEILQTSFSVNPRTKVFRFLKDNGLLYEIQNLNDLFYFIGSNTDNQVVLIDRSKLEIPMDQLRAVLANFRFFFALPGRIMPLCHNIVEAMSCGCICLIEEGYADLLEPVLEDDFTAKTFQGLASLKQAIADLFSWPEEKMDFIRANVERYYQDHLAPAGVVNKFIASGKKKIYLQAEEISVDLLRKNN